MSELRAPDPTLTALSGPVGVDFMSPHPAVAHATLEGAITVQTQCGLRCSDLAPASYARWFAVPCRKCFPDAPPPGRKYATSNEDRWFAIYVEQVDPADGPLTVSGPYLGWQRPAEVAS